MSTARPSPKCPARPARATEPTAGYAGRPDFFFGTQDGLTKPIAAIDAEQFTPKLVLIADDGRHLQATSRFDFHEYAHAIVHEYYEHPHPD